ncbi:MULTISPECIES: substrate-binding domain-containing protein [Pseudomonadota]|jgi:DNA-binding transcriptional LysR family regulator|uniref:substrate-binding domain-containing protein n=1 Tax=Pseudomonadota TaxID=1224 RepID=UPI001B42BC78|nr:substrate-binding domain-containing protein [Achromobacter xylosoxidans]MBP7655148.1 substrate-binding domain-containing protein [Pseudoxanthomonas sp.]MCH4578059.1 substrate-binding domain-containing protein [Achromobacter xylosoxidans]
MHTTSRPPPLTLALAPDVPWAPLASVLAAFRAEVPRTDLVIRQTHPDGIMEDLEEGRYDLAIAPALDSPTSPLTNSQLLWREELAVVAPPRSPLLAYPSTLVAALRDYPLIQWCPRAHTALHRHVDTLVGSRNSPTYIAISFDFMVALVAAGFGIGIAQRSRLAQVREWQVAVRRFAERDHWLEIRLYWTSARSAPVAARFAEHARSVADSYDPDRSIASQ